MTNNIWDYAEDLKPGRPRQITFISAAYQDEDGTSTCVRTNVNLGDGDVAGVIKIIVENGGIGQVQEDGSYVFVPWPPAAIFVRDLSDEEYEKLARQEP